MCHYDHQCILAGEHKQEVCFQISAEGFYVDFLNSPVALACHLEDLRFRMVREDEAGEQQLKATCYRDGCYWELLLNLQDGMVLAQIMREKLGPDRVCGALLGLLRMPGLEAAA